MNGRKLAEVDAYIGLGTNMGDRERHLRDALALLGERSGIRLLRASAVYETDPVGFTEQPAFLNMVALLRTDLPAEALLDELLDIERTLGRTRDIRWGPRTIDLDLLLYGTAKVKTERLDVPHPRMAERAFVLIPLLDVIDFEPFAERGALRELVAHIEGKDGVKRWSPTTL
ncbi:2-amino-4-hydroxy-6-hydroxymethyldihydropteridine diphosphokinase [Paenibacillus cymbidii]|uniref:2-amino-4-hydroxy-6- hydroxymethyldihydropteridine diphosphokinase n=1 Tax=Paenibacillus cymbidii TaxID=1639034 RepID=UPI00108136BC|nr:2-amino-4-hydroxy-6-hydroxymethyldihydropteridine diphosphokinase [Paenibacillus cymbidii]